MKKKYASFCYCIKRFIIFISNSAIRCDKIAKGYYKYGNKDSVWDEFYSKGSYKNGEKVGICEFYDFNGKVYKKYDYTNHRLKSYIVYLSLKPAKYQIVINGDTLFKILKRRPIPLLYVTSGLKFSGLHYPNKAIENDVTGLVEVSFMIHEDGSASDFKVEKSLGYGCDELSMEVAKNMMSWIPGIYKGKPVALKKNIVVDFDLLDEYFEG